MDYKEIGNYIRLLRKAKGLTQKDLAEMLSISFQAVSKWEIGETLPDTSILLDLCDILDTSVDKLLNGGVFVKKEKKLIRVESIIEGFEHIEKVKNCFGSSSEFYRGIVNGINTMMNFDFEDAYAHHRQVLYAEVILRFLSEGYKVDADEVRKFITQESLVNEILRRM